MALRIDASWLAGTDRTVSIENYFLTTSDVVFSNKLYVQFETSKLFLK